MVSQSYFLWHGNHILGKNTLIRKQDLVSMSCVGVISFIKEIQIRECTHWTHAFIWNIIYVRIYLYVQGVILCEVNTTIIHSDCAMVVNVCNSFDCNCVIKTGGGKILFYDNCAIVAGSNNWCFVLIIFHNDYSFYCWPSIIMIHYNCVMINGEYIHIPLWLGNNCCWMHSRAIVIVYFYCWLGYSCHNY